MFLKILLYLLLKKVIGKVVSLEQWVYIEGRSILDEPLVINELYTWAKKTKKKVLIFKFDFNKAFDSLNWGFLDSVMEQMDFSNKLRGWIKWCLSSGRASILVNGSATKEFDIKMGVRQDDPISSFLFILVMEGLNIAMKKLVIKTYIKVSFFQMKMLVFPTLCMQMMLYLLVSCPKWTLSTLIESWDASTYPRVWKWISIK